MADGIIEQDSFWPKLKGSVRGYVEAYSSTIWIFIGIAVVFYFFIKPRIEKYLHTANSRAIETDPEKANQYHEKRRLAIAKLQEQYQEKAKELGLKKVEPKPETVEEEEEEEEVCMLSSKPTATVPTSTKPTASSSNSQTFKKLRPAYNPLDGSGATSRFKPSCNSRKKGG
mmetsp:Transcript_5201/g.7306  ORF Transcript_5201/g.7306 Transcript_5201/m.7306 type:complete len:171 (+) Transcript_5201:127-639(+)|eukprot:CAMPEP_0168558088 /NCGR_PEP_ID=MMETSP0413-20121227/9778_1 /TAXON_ID=136452 /ORGANISM="Filamoeba nolandi, Strain NC-AS-23-1" /LENGTH=170 /DNA_ID=CAMNT_0008589175 /DNA_START=109 /DNA_END=621 /DNA_ORIENTATION=+